MIKNYSHSLKNRTLSETDVPELPYNPYELSLLSESTEDEMCESSMEFENTYSQLKKDFVTREVSSIERELKGIVFENHDRMCQYSSKTARYLS